jgi:NAD(P)-dependent dehydrogenase (short-subunit alcohol dehydrogenase family)
MESILMAKICLITGASSVMGRAAALVFAREGAVTVLADVDEQGGMETAAMVKEQGGETLFIPCDVSSTAQVMALFQQILRAYDRLDCAFNNAGWEGKLAPTADCDEETWERVIAVNLKGVWLCMKQEIQQMFQQGGGAIVNTSSVAGLIAERGYAAYAAAKGGVIQLTRTAAVEYAGAKIRINAVCPGAIRTQLFDRSLKASRLSQMMPGTMRPSFMTRIADAMMGTAPVQNFVSTMMQPMGHPGRPEDVAEAAAWLCSDAAAFITGQALVIDGGMTAA